LERCNFYEFLLNPGVNVFLGGSGYLSPSNEEFKEL